MGHIHEYRPLKRHNEPNLLVWTQFLFLPLSDEKGHPPPLQPFIWPSLMEDEGAISGNAQWAEGQRRPLILQRTGAAFIYTWRKKRESIQTSQKLSFLSRFRLFVLLLVRTRRDDQLHFRSEDLNMTCVTAVKLHPSPPAAWPKDIRRIKNNICTQH